MQAPAEGVESRFRPNEAEVSPSNFIFAAKDVLCCPQLRPPSKMKFERLTLARENRELEGL
jgi:hypothetical protein